MDGVEQIEQVLSGEGNNQTSPFNASFQSKNWVITWNNYPDNVFEQIEQGLVPLCEKYIFGKEVGEKGTPHIQGAFMLKRKMRQGTIYKLFNTTFYLEKMKGRWNDQKYCAKDGDYISNFIFRDKRPKQILSYEQLNAWELKIHSICATTVPDDRIIYWFWSKNGNLGKTTFCKYLHATFDCCVIGGKSADSKNCIATFIDKSSDKRAPEVVVCPIPRSYNADYISYEAIEMIKDMFFYSGKYEGGQVNDNSPHLFVFGNVMPDWEKMSKDRWEVYEILDEEGNYEKTDYGEESDDY